MKKRIIFLLFIFLIVNISGICNENQIDINTATLEELDKLTGIGPAKAQSIIDSRPFNSVNSLIDVIGIGEITLEKIKNQGIACVSEEKNNINELEHENVEEEKKESDEESIKEENNNIQNDKVEEEKEIIKENVEIKQEKVNDIQKELIVLTSLDTKDIKSEKNKEKLEKNNYIIYGLVGFGIIILFLSIIKNHKLLRKNEFR